MYVYVLHERHINLHSCSVLQRNVLKSVMHLQSCCFDHNQLLMQMNPPGSRRGLGRRLP